ncbi:protein RIC-3-like [Salvelinus alpinus]|uniref:protein RIC-3-like n=1 Tax=Salvelinus alpinus TaxID=8036 RepID=UPI0039FBE266
MVHRPRITSKVKSVVPAELRFPSVRGENRKEKITDFQLTHLQDTLRETEMVMERIVSKASYSSKRVTGVSADQEERLLLQLREITRVMQEGRLAEGVAPPEMGAQCWEGFPEDPHPCWEEPFCGCDHSQATSTEEQPETTNGSGADQEEGGAEDDEGGAEAGSDLNTDEGAADLSTGNEEGGAKCDVGGTEVEKEGMYREEGGANDKLGVADNEMGVAEEQGEELEYTLKMYMVLE